MICNYHTVQNIFTQYKIFQHLSFEKPQNPIQNELYGKAELAVCLWWGCETWPAPWTDNWNSFFISSSPRHQTTLKANHLNLSNAQRICHQIRIPCKLPDTLVHAPVWQNHAFPPSFTDPAFREWSNEGITAIIPLYISQHFASFDKLQAKFSLVPHSISYESYNNIFSRINTKSSSKMDISNEKHTSISFTASCCRLVTAMCPIGSCCKTIYCTVLFWSWKFQST